MKPHMIRVEDDEWAVWQTAAEREGRKVSDWVRQVCSAAARSVNFDPVTVGTAWHEPVRKRGGYQPVAAGPPPTTPPPQPSDAARAQPAGRVALDRRDVTPRPRPGGKKK